MQEFLFANYTPFITHLLPRIIQFTLLYNYICCFSLFASVTENEPNGISKSLLIIYTFIMNNETRCYHGVYILKKKKMKKQRRQTF